MCLTIGLEWTRDGASCLYSKPLGPAPLRPGVRPQHTTYSMNRFARAWKAAVRGYREGVMPDQSAPTEYQSGGHRIRCPQCGGERFLVRPPMMFCWATILTCDRCGLEQRYGKEPERVA